MNADPREHPRFTELFQRYVEELQEKGFIDPDAIIESHTELGPALVEDLETYIQLRPFGETAPEAPLGKLGDYTLRRQIGRGGMGIVYEAWQGSMDRTVALKVLPPGIAADDRAYGRFMQEARAAGKLGHPNVVAVYASGQDESTPYYAMEYVDGETLAQVLGRIKEAGDASETTFGKKGELAFYSNLASAFADVADGLQHAHSKGVTHRDIKPSNLILDTDSRLRILDFGLARLEGQESLTRSGDFVGTPLYMSPEQARRKKIPIDQRTDIYSLGATMYEAICGRPPFRGKDHADTLSQIIERDPVEPRKVNPRVPKNLETIVLKCLQKDSDDRYGTAEALAQDLRRFARGDAVEAKRQTAYERLALWARRRAVLIGVSGLVLLLVFVAGWITTAVVWKARNETQHALEELRAYADLRLLSALNDDEERLWPCLPENLSEIEAWVKGAEALVSRLDEHETDLEVLRRRALPYGDEQRQLDRKFHPRARELEKLEREREDLAKKAKSLEGGSPTRLLSGPAVLRDKAARLSARIQELREAVNERTTWRFSDIALEEKHDTLAELVAGVRDLQSPENGLSAMRSRLEFARNVYRWSIEDHRQDWDRAIASIGDEVECPQYRGLKLAPQVGLVPIGQDPKSRLWEFAHLQTGDVPERDGDGKLILAPDSGLVFVLIPEGTFFMGAVKPSVEEAAHAPNVDRLAAEDEGPVHEVSLDAFFLSKYEMTQAQWLAFTGANPSLYSKFYFTGPNGEAEYLLHPVERVTWHDCDRVLERLGLMLPTEAQWEYAARAGTTTIWWTGDDRESLRGAANLADVSCATGGGLPLEECAQWFEDGFVYHAPVGRLEANHFGLHDTMGNVAEWCRDRHGSYTLDVIQPDAARDVPIRRTHYVYRGGGWNHEHPSMRSADRKSWTPASKAGWLGVRPARRLEN